MWSIRFEPSAVDFTLKMKGMRMANEPLRATEAARRLGISTKELLTLVHERKIRYVMVEGIAHVPVDAVDEYRAKTSR
jgi:excisionase family DNA binding protein